MINEKNNYKNYFPNIRHSSFVIGYLPKRGTASDVAGIVSATMLRKTVNDNKIVTPVNIKYISGNYGKEDVCSKDDKVTACLVL